MHPLKISYKQPTQLHSRNRNPRTHPPRQIKQIAASIREFGFLSPIFVDSSDTIIAGHARVEAAKMLQMSDVPTVRVDHLSPAQIRMYVIADNRLAELAGWDSKLLALDLQELSIQPNFDVTITGFDGAEVDIIIGEQTKTTLPDDDELPKIDRTGPAVSRPGDLWQIGRHFLLCGNALERSSYKSLLGAAKAQLVFTDPPYNLSIRSFLRVRNSRRREFAMASGEMSQDQYEKFLQATFANLCAMSIDGSIHFVCIDWRHIREVLDAAESCYRELKNICIWCKTNAGMGSLYRSQHEFVCVFKNGTAPHVNNVELGRFGRNRTNVWAYASPSSFGKDRDASQGHPTAKPLALVADAIMDCSRRGAVVLDAFAGSGTTLIAAERTGRVGYGIELDPHYVDAILKRFVGLCGLSATHAGSKKPFEVIATERGRTTSRHKSNGEQNGTA